MCGIIGVINGSSEIKSRLGSIFDEMLWADQIRGTDGAGVMWFDSRDDKYSVLKDEDISAVRGSKDYKHALAWIEKMPFFIGHNRSATRGTVSSENNHPFDEGNVVLVHNGTMTYIPKEYDDGTHVDSHAIAKMIHKASPQEFMKKSFGAFALVWFDKVSRKLNILRNSQRPLNLVYFKDFVLISSEAMLAAWCAARNGHGYEKIEEVKEHVLYQFEPYNIKNPVITDLSSLKTFHTEPYRREYGTYFENEMDDVDIWRNQRPQRHLVVVNSAKEEVDKQRGIFNRINPWLYFEGVHGISRKETEPTEQNGVLSFKKGDKVSFIIDGGQEHGSFTHFIAKLPNKSIKEYCIRGNVPYTLDELLETDNLWSGEISEIKSKHNLITLYVKDAEPIEIIKDAEVIEEKQQQG